MAAAVYTAAVVRWVRTFSFSSRFSFLFLSNFRSNIWPLKFWNCQATPQKIIRNNVSMLDIFSWPLASTKNWKKLKKIQWIFVWQSFSSFDFFQLLHGVTIPQGSFELQTIFIYFDVRFRSINFRWCFASHQFVSFQTKIAQRRSQRFAWKSNDKKVSFSNRIRLFFFVVVSRRPSLVFHRTVEPVKPQENRLQHWKKPRLLRLRLAPVPLENRRKKQTFFSFFRLENEVISLFLCFLFCCCVLCWFSSPLK